MWFCEKAAQCHGIDLSKFPTEPAARGKADAAYDAVVQLLCSHALVPGQHLSDRDLALKLKMGRTPLREALIRLAAEGKIVSLPQRGYFTRPLIEWALLDSYAVAREILAFALARVRPQAACHCAPFDELTPAELALRAEAIFTEIAQAASNCEMCKIIDKFCFCTHTVRMEIAASEISTSFGRSIAKLTDAMPQLGSAPGVVEAALISHLDLERGALPRVVQNMNTRWLTSFPLVARSL
ncbi:MULTISPECIES: GntR family transcriptional regulator [unclassified Sinorhizobium]|uniref:GntR family transcriptional regulator n=1 Tax=unclassified Sinorhizobium TaxID=2613772 RepID=UPI0024C33DA8|nr:MULTISPECIES: GntR family transcriptional regulator [unclassified Sinorhizobium]MDK1378130.1 GntR family transcriptional regulator [Sinorhizobium sp. 6-70]MDK1482328.1 GntR family transcriptional regulator [Sinorhizobium sp. 6-117]